MSWNVRVTEIRHFSSTPQTDGHIPIQGDFFNSRVMVLDLGTSLMDTQCAEAPPFLVRASQLLVLRSWKRTAKKGGGSQSHNNQVEPTKALLKQVGHKEVETPGHRARTEAVNESAKKGFAKGGVETVVEETEVSACVVVHQCTP